MAMAPHAKQKKTSTVLSIPWPDASRKWNLQNRHLVFVMLGSFRGDVGYVSGMVLNENNEDDARNEIYWRFTGKEVVWGRVYHAMELPAVVALLPLETSVVHQSSRPDGGSRIGQSQERHLFLCAMPFFYVTWKVRPAPRSLLCNVEQIRPDQTIANRTNNDALLCKVEDERPAQREQEPTVPTLDNVMREHHPNAGRARHD
jgi:hypothetical protein